MTHDRDREREQRSVEAIRHLSEEIAELVDLRGRIAQARAIAARHGKHVDIIAALDGRPPEFTGRPEHGSNATPGTYRPACRPDNPEED